MSFKILKVKNGEELIAWVTETKTTVNLSNPMVFRTATMLNEHNIPYDLTVLKDWLKFNTLKVITLKKSEFISITEPSAQSIKFYLLERDRLDITPKEDIVKTTEPPSALNKLSKIPLSPNDKESLDLVESMMNDIFNQLKNMPPERFKSFPLPPGMTEDMINDDEEGIFPDFPMIPPEMMEKKMIFMSMTFPPEMIMDMITSGLLKSKDFNKIVKQVKKDNKFTGDEKNRKDFGNKWTDWNPDIHGEEYK